MSSELTISGVPVKIDKDEEKNEQHFGNQLIVVDQVEEQMHFIRFALRLWLLRTANGEI